MSFTEDVTARVMEKLAEGGFGSSVVNAFKNFVPDTIQSVSDFAADPKGIARRALHEAWNPEGAGFFGKAFNRGVAFGLPALEAYHAISKPSETSFEDIGRMGGSALATAALPMTTTGILPGMALGMGAMGLGGAIGKGLDRITGRGRAVARAKARAEQPQMPEGYAPIAN